MTIRELQREGQERLQKAYEALKLPDTEGYTGTVEREYQKELARNLQKDGSKAANASTDQRIAGKLKVAGYSLDEIKDVIEQCSPMAVKPSQEQRQAYAVSVVEKAHFLPNNKSKKTLEETRLLGECRLDKLEIGTKLEFAPESKNDVLSENISHPEIKNISGSEGANIWKYMLPLSPSMIASSLIDIDKEKIEIEIKFSHEDFINLCKLLEWVSCDLDRLIPNAERLEFDVLSQSLLVLLTTQLVEQNSNDFEYLIRNKNVEKIQKEDVLGWTFLLVECCVSASEIQIALAKIFSLEFQNIIVFGFDSDWDTSIDDNVLLICEYREVSGDFKIALTIDIQKNVLEEIEEELGGEVEITRKLCNILNCSCLIVYPATNVKNNDACLLINSDIPDVQEVYLDPEKLNLDTEEYYILKTNP